MANNGFATGEDKGKGKATDESARVLDQATSSRHEPGKASLVNRISNSTWTLSGALLSASSGNDVLPKVWTGGKGESSHTGTSSGPVHTGESSVPLQPRASTDTTLRSTHTHEHMIKEEAAFADFLDGRSVFVPSEPSGLDRAWQSNGLAANPVPATGTARSVVGSSVAAQGELDGQEVVALLSGKHEEELNRIPENGVPAEELYKLREALFGDGRKQSPLSMKWDHVLNFIPEYLRQGDSTQAQEATLQLGIADRGQAWHTWIDQWSTVLTTYMDDVWGDLAPLVREARAEVARLDKAKSDDQDAPLKVQAALLRLRAILRHLRGV